MANLTPRIDPQHAQLPLYAGVDVGGTNIKLGLVDDLGRTVAATQISTQEEQGPEAALQRIAQAIDDLIEAVRIDKKHVAAAGLGTPGTMDIGGGMILDPPNMPHWRFFPVRDRLSELTQLPVSYNNDANVAAFGEYWVGTGRQHRSMLMLTLGTGVGGGIIVNEQLLDGENSFGGECGHIVVDSRDDARLCVWGGGRGELEAYASASAVVERAREALAVGRSSSLVAELSRGTPLSARLMADEAEQGDPLCREIILDTARYLGIAIVTFVHTLDPGMVVLGGAMNFGGQDTQIGRDFLQGIRDEFQRRAFPQVIAGTTIDFARLGGDAGYIGAAGIARFARRAAPPA